MATVALADGILVCVSCEGAGANLPCTGGCGRSFHDACAGVTAGQEAAKEWRCGRCSKIKVCGLAFYFFDVYSFFGIFVDRSAAFCLVPLTPSLTASTSS